MCSVLAAATAPRSLVDVKSRKIGELTLENDFLERAHQGGISERKAMIDREHDLPITKQAEVRISATPKASTCLGRFRQPTSRSRGVSTGCIWVPFAGSRMLQGLLVAEGAIRPPWSRR